MIAIGACRTIDRSDPIAESPADPPQGKTLRSPWQHHKRRKSEAGLGLTERVPE
jgi:hypothetical protein